MTNKKRIALLLAVLCLITAVFAGSCFAASPTDEILNYAITAELNDDATVNLTYHLDWKVLESDGIGPVSWVNIGIPNSECVNIEPLSSNIVDIVYTSEYGSGVDVYFDRSYYEGEVISFEFMITQDYMYQMNLYEEGYTTYVFTPGWFDEIAVDKLVISWAEDGLYTWSPNCLTRNGYNVWETSLMPGETFTVTVNYPNDVCGFSESKYILDGERWNDDWDDDWDDDWGGGGFAIFGEAFSIIFIAAFAVIAKAVNSAYKSGTGFKSSDTKTKITRTKVTYYPVCQGCGAARGDGETKCSYCGRSFIKSEEILKEEEIKDEDKEALKFKTNGEFRYSSSPDTFVRVNVVHVPVYTGSRGGSSRGGSSRGGSSRGGGCAHSSCACACASCACACACACAGGGRAGCTSKDFYSTDLKLRQLELRKKHKKNN